MSVCLRPAVPQLWAGSHETLVPKVAVGLPDDKSSSQQMTADSQQPASCSHARQWTVL